MRITELPATSEAALTDYIAIDDSSLGTRKLLLSDIRASSVYWSVDDLGLTVGSAALADVWAAMDDGSQAIFMSYELSAGDRPSSSDMVVSIVRVSETEGTIEAYPLSSASDKRMYLSDDAPSGQWLTKGRLMFTMSNVMDMALPYTINDDRITSDMRVIESIVYNEAALASDLTVTTSNGSFVMDGKLIGTTKISIILEATN